MWNLELRRDGSEEGVRIGHSVPGQPLGKYWDQQRRKPWEGAVRPDRKQEDAKSKLYPLEDLCWARFHLILSNIIDYL